MSFFDEAEETRGAPRPRRPPSRGGGGHRHQGPDHQTLLVRRLVAAGGIVVFLILVSVLIKGCVSNSRTQGLKDYNRRVTDLSSRSVSAVSKPLFQALAGAQGKSQGDVQNTVNQLRDEADRQLGEATRMSVPGEMKGAQQALELVLGLRRDGVARIALLIGPAVSQSASASSSVDQIAGQMRAFDASDVLYSQRVAPQILKALKDDGVAASYDGSSGDQVTAYSSFLPDVSWISGQFVGQQLGASSGSSTSTQPATPGPHGHKLDSVSVGGTTLDAGSSNTIPANPAPTFTVNFTNSGDSDETNVKVSVEVSGGGQVVKGSKTVATTTKGSAATADVQLSGPPPTSGPTTVKVTVEKVPGESNMANNTQSFPVLFTG